MTLSTKYLLHQFLLYSVNQYSINQNSVHQSCSPGGPPGEAAQWPGEQWPGGGRPAILSVFMLGSGQDCIVVRSVKWPGGGRPGILGVVMSGTMARAEFLARRRKKIRSQFWTPKKRYYPILFWCFSSFLSYNFFKKSKNAKILNSNTYKFKFLFQGST